VNKGLIFDIRRFSVHDGPGIRTTVFFKGCPMDCWWCHNPESRLPFPETSTRTLILGDRSFPVEETTGREMTVGEVVDAVVRDRIFYETSGGGVTLSGGEPLFQPEFTAELAAALKKENIHVAIDTCGYATADAFRAILLPTDLFLYDLKIMDDGEHRKYSGVSNALVHQNLAMLLREGKSVIIRIPLIPGITDTEQNIDTIISFLTQLTTLPEIHLLPYHSAAATKYSRFGKENRIAGLEEPGRESIEAIRLKFAAINVKVKIGG
jgi:pyruvate formate lyase activating enzyme